MTLTRDTNCWSIISGGLVAGFTDSHVWVVCGGGLCLTLWAVKPLRGLRGLFYMDDSLISASSLVIMRIS